VVLVLVPQKAWAAIAPTADDGMRGEDDRGHHGRCGRANDIHKRLRAVTKASREIGARPGEVATRRRESDV
jgi:hypothetical protein